MPDLREQLLHCFEGRVCLMGLGNVASGDDGFGVRLAEVVAARKAGSAPEDVCVINAGMMPERFVGAVVKEDFDHVVFLDAVDFNGQPGSAVFLNAGEIAARFPQVSTHKISLGLLARWVEENGRTKAWLLGAQPESLKTTQGLTLTMQKTLEALAELICGLVVSGEKPTRQEVFSQRRREMQA